MNHNVVVTIEQLDTSGHVWRTEASHMVASNVERSLAAIRSGYNMERTRVTVDGEVVSQPRRR